MEKSIFYDELISIYKEILAEEQLSKQSYSELMNFFYNWEKENEENMDDYCLNYLILNLIDYISTLPSTIPALQLYIKKIKLKIFTYTVETLPKVLDTQFTINSKINENKIFYQNDEGVIIKSYYVPKFNDYKLPDYGNTSTLNINGTLKNGKKYIQKVKINHRGRVLSLVGDWYEDIDLSKEQSQEDYDKIFESMVKNILDTQND